MPAGYGYEGSGSRKMGNKKKKYGESYSHISSGVGKLKEKAMKKGSMGGGAQGSQDVDAVGKKTPMKHEGKDMKYGSKKKGGY